MLTKPAPPLSPVCDNARDYPLLLTPKNEPTLYSCSVICYLGALEQEKLSVIDLPE